MYKMTKWSGCQRASIPVHIPQRIQWIEDRDIRTFWIPTFHRKWCNPNITYCRLILGGIIPLCSVIWQVNNLKKPTKLTYTKDQLNPNLCDLSDKILSQAWRWETTPLFWWKACDTLWISLVSQSIYIYTSMSLQIWYNEANLFLDSTRFHLIHEYMRSHIVFRCKTVLVIISMNTPLPSEICIGLCLCISEILCPGASDFLTQC